MPHQCVRCAAELLEPLPECCPRCGLPVIRSLPPREMQQSPSVSADHQALATDKYRATELIRLPPAEHISSSPTVEELSSHHALQPRRMTPVWLPLSVTALLSSLLLCGLMLVPLGSALTKWGSGVVSQVALLTSGTPTALATPAKSKPYEFHDTLRRGNVWGWPAGTTGNASCLFADDGYHVQDGIICNSPVLPLTDGEIVATMNILAGPTGPCAAIRFRSEDSDNFYSVFLGHDGTWWMGKTVDSVTETILPIQQHEAIHAGLGVANTVEIVMWLDHFTVYVNKIQIGVAEDATFSGGTMAFVAIPGVEAVFSDLSVIADA
jgi:hypothetical protein